MALTHPPLVPTPHEPDAEGRDARHRAMVRYMDHAVGRLVGALDTLGLRERTIVLFTTDNGTSKGITGRMHGREVPGGKGTLGENGTRAPFIVRAPGLVPSGVRTDALTDFTDLLPTFADLAGAAVPDSLTIDGRSIAPVLRGEDERGPREWMMAMGFGPARLTEEGVVPVQVHTDRVIRDRRYKLWVLDGHPVRLYDLEADPAEQTDLFDSPDPASVAARDRLSSVAASFPRRDGRPRYVPNPPQPWDRKPEKEE